MFHSVCSRRGMDFSTVPARRPDSTASWSSVRVVRAYGAVVAPDYHAVMVAQPVTDHQQR